MKLSNEDKAGLYITAIIHLVVIIALMVLKITAHAVRTHFAMN